MSNPLLDLMRIGESGAAGYNAYNRGTQGNRIVPADRPIDFSRLTVGQVQELQDLPRRDPDRLFAVGKYQIVPDTMDAAVRHLKLDPKAQFTPQLQDRIFSEYLIVAKRPGVHAYITGQPGATLDRAQYQLSLEWASFGDPTKGGASHYGGANKAHVTLEQSEKALKEMRAEYKACIDKGMSPQQAWKEVTGGEPARTQAPAQPQAPAPEKKDEPSGKVHLDDAHRMGIKYDDVRYGLGAKSLAAGRIDCAGWVKEVTNATMAEINRESGRKIFDDSDRFSTMTSEDMIERTYKRSGILLTGKITADMLKEGMVIGEDNGPTSFDKGRKRGIDHIVVVVRDPTSGELMISQSSGGRANGVNMLPVDRYLANKQANGTKLFATDPLAEARDVLDGRAVRGGTSQPTPAPQKPASPMADKVLQMGERGAEIRTLQTALDRLGYKDADGHRLKADGVFGESTKEALQAFQRDNGLKGLGVYGPLSQKAMHEANLKLVTAPQHTHHALYEQVLDKVHAAEKQKGVGSGLHSERLAAALTVEALREGITRVDRVELNANGTLARAVQVSATRDEPGLNRSTDGISTAQATNQSIAESSQQVHQVAVNLQSQEKDRQMRQPAMAP